MLVTMSEKEHLAEVLNTYRNIAVWKLEGLSLDDATRAGVPSGTSLLGIVKHLAYVERWWFQAVLGRRDVEFPWTDDDPDADWRIEDDDTIASVVALYRAECAISNQILEALDSLDAEVTMGSRTRIARPIVLHVIEEIARHVGHMDIIRESIDGSTGWGPDDT
jgi:uncharacterized damage-inducible protein DinB